MKKKSILIFTEYYLPGYKAGGPIRSVSNLVDWLGDEFNFFIVTSACDYGEKVHYPNVPLDMWTTVGKAKVQYLKNGAISPTKVLTIIRETDPDLLMFNSFFSPRFTIIPLLIAKIKSLFKYRSVMIAPRGEFAPDALRIKLKKKKLFIRFAGLIGLYSDVNWTFTNEKEKNEFLENIAFSNRSVNFLPNLPKKGSNVALHTTDKEKGKLKIIYLGRVARIKNLKFALEVLSEISDSKIEYDIFGVLDDPEYWEGCKDRIKKMPSNITVRYQGHIENHRVTELLSGYHLFFQPSKSENFGHSIYESLLSGTPVLISDQTPWRGLEKKGLGYDLPLSSKKEYQKVISRYAEMDSAEMNQVKREVFKVIRSEKVYDTVEQNRKVFNTLLN